MNRDLQASHEMILMLERAKNLSESMLDQFTGPLFYTLIDGRILRGNLAGAKLMQENIEKLIEHSVKALFSESDWQLILSNIPTLTDEKSNYELSSSIQIGSRTQTILWTISLLNISTDFGVKVLSFLGRDITEVLLANSKVANLKKDLEVVEAVQNLMLPQKNFYRSSTIAYNAIYRSAGISSGDFWWIDPTLDEKKLYVIIGDVTGHGSGSAMVTSMISGSIKSAVTFAHDKSNGQFIPKCFECIHNNLRSLPNSDYWFPVLGLEISLIDDQCTWWSAGAPQFIQLQPGKPITLMQPQQSLPLGAYEGTLSSGHIEFCPGDQLVLFTDGVSEMLNPARIQFGMRRAQSVFQSATTNSTMNCTSSCNALVDALEQWRKDRPLDDDYTILCIDRL